MDFFNHRELGMVFCQVVFFSPLQCTVTNCESCKRLREFEEIEISRHSCRDDYKKMYQCPCSPFQLFWRIARIASLSPFEVSTGPGPPCSLSPFSFFVWTYHCSLLPSRIKLYSSPPPLHIRN